jgi:hypothetical protein
MEYSHDVQRWRNPCQSSCYGILVCAVTELIQGSQHIDISLYFDSQDIYLWIEIKITNF